MSLKNRLEISELIENGQRFPTDYFTLVWQPASQVKFGVFLSRRHGASHQRNRIKRLYREAFRLNQNRLRKVGKIAVLPRLSNREPKLELLIADVSRIFDKLNSAE